MLALQLVTMESLVWVLDSSSEFGVFGTVIAVAHFVEFFMKYGFWRPRLQAVRSVVWPALLTVLGGTYATPRGCICICVNISGRADMVIECTPVELVSRPGCGTGSIERKISVSECTCYFVI